MRTLLVILLIVVIVLVVVPAIAVWLSFTLARRSVDRRNQVVPGVPTGAPRSWLGSHTAEARLHRRLRDLVAGMQRAAAASPAVASAEADVTRLALRLDDKLVAAAAAPGDSRQGAIEKLAKSVEKLEQTVGGLIEAASSPDDDAIDDLSHWLNHLEEARAELE